MTVQTSKNRFSLDSLLVLEPENSANITATGASTNFLTLDQLSAYWNSGDNANELDFAVVIEVTAWDHTTGDETYQADVQVATASNFGSPVAVATKLITGTGRYVLVIDRDAIVAALGSTTTTGFLRLEMTLAGTTPILNYYAYVSPLVGL